MNNATQGIFTPKNYEIYHPNKNALSKNLSAKSEYKPKQMKYLNEWHKQCYEGIHTKNDEISFSKDELVPIFARFCLHKAKLYFFCVIFVRDKFCKVYLRYNYYK